MSMYCGGHGLRLPCLECEKNTRNRKDAEQAYTVTAFDYQANPVGCRDWCVFFEGWQAARFPERWSTESENAPERAIGSTESGRGSTGGGEGLTALIASVMEDADCYAQTAAEYGSRFEARTERECLEENLRSAIATSTQGQAKESGNG